MTVTIGFIGFGEAGHAIAKGLAGQGLATRAYDILVHDPAARAVVYQRAADAGTQLTSMAPSSVAATVTTRGQAQQVAISTDSRRRGQNTSFR